MDSELNEAYPPGEMCRKVPYNQMKGHQLPPFIELKNADGTMDTYYSLFYNDVVPKKVQNIALEELNETEEKKKDGLQRLRDVLKAKGLSGEDDLLLLCCLRKSKYKLKKAESQLLKYLKTRKDVLQMFRKADMKRLEHVLDYMVVGLLPYRDKKGRAIFFTRPNFNLQLFDVNDSLICFFVILSFILNSSCEITSITGVVYIGEAKTQTLDILYPFMKAFRSQLGRIVSFPGRVAKIEILNEIVLVRWTVNLLKVFLTAKSVGRITFYGKDIINMRKTYHPDLLPEEFGGTMGPLSNIFYKEEIMNFMKKLRSEETIEKII